MGTSMQKQTPWLRFLLHKITETPHCMEYIHEGATELDDIRELDVHEAKWDL